MNCTRSSETRNPPSSERSWQGRRSSSRRDPSSRERPPNGKYNRTGAARATEGGGDRGARELTTELTSRRSLLGAHPSCSGSGRRSHRLTDQRLSCRTGSERRMIICQVRPVGGRSLPTLGLELTRPDAILSPSCRGPVRKVQLGHSCHGLLTTGVRQPPQRSAQVPFGLTTDARAHLRLSSLFVRTLFRRGLVPDRDELPVLPPARV